MAHFAHIENGIVQQVIAIRDNDAQDPAPFYSEPMGQAFIRDKLKLAGEWRQTSYNGTFRKNYAGLGYRYDEVLDAFIPPKPYPSWVVNEETCLWEAPVPYPEGGEPYNWNEEEQRWDLLNNE
jgi:hypothetical protein